MNKMAARVTHVMKCDHLDWHQTLIPSTTWAIVLTLVHVQVKQMDALSNHMQKLRKDKLELGRLQLLNLMNPQCTEKFTQNDLMVAFCLKEVTG